MFYPWTLAGAHSQKTWWMGSVPLFYQQYLLYLQKNCKQSFSKKCRKFKLSIKSVFQLCLKRTIKIKSKLWFCTQSFVWNRPILINLRKAPNRWPAELKSTPRDETVGYLFDLHHLYLTLWFIYFNLKAGFGQPVYDGFPGCLQQGLHYVSKPSTTAAMPNLMCTCGRLTFLAQMKALSYSIPITLL